MIQFKRGSSESWRKLKKPLAAGQPGYDKDKHKIKVGDGEKLWDKLPYASISEEEVLDSEKNARARRASDSESLSIITYGTENPSKNMVGKLYLQYYDTEPETDYVVQYGRSQDGIWFYRKWHSGVAECWCTLPVTTPVKTVIDNTNLYSDNKAMKKINYPFSFKTVDGSMPFENATLRSPGGIAWLAGRSGNTKSASGEYSIISTNSLDNATYNIMIQVKGYWK